MVMTRLRGTILAAAVPLFLISACAQTAGNQAAGAAQDLYGQAKDVASDAAAAAKSGAVNAGDFLRETIEQRPLTSALVAFGLGFVLASMPQRD